MEEAKKRKVIKLEIPKSERVRNIYYRNGYNQGMKRLVDQHKDKERQDVLEMVDRLARFQVIGNQNSTHKLRGNKGDYKDIHIRGNLVLLYKYINDDIYIDLELKDLTDHDYGLSKKRKLK